jgi:hypothetical protein
VSDDYDEAPTRYVAVRNVDNGCACATSSLDEVETPAPRHVVVKSDYLAGTQEIITPTPSYDDTAYMTPPVDTVVGSPEDVAYTNAAYTGGDDDNFVPVSNMASSCACPEAVSTRTINYIPVSNDYDNDDQAILDNDGTTYVAADDVGNAYLSPVAYQTSPEMTRMQAVSYVPVESVDDIAFQGGDTAYLAADNAVSTTSSIPMADDDEAIAGTGTIFITANDFNNRCSCSGNMGAGAVSYIPTGDVGDIDADNISFVPADSVDYVDTGGIAASESSTY